MHVVRGEIKEKATDIQARSFLARTLGQNGKKCQAEGGSKSGLMKKSAANGKQWIKNGQNLKRFQRGT